MKKAPPVDQKTKVLGDDGKSKLPQWAIDAGFHSYTMMSNDILKAMYSPGQPTQQRLFAWIVRHSSGNQSAFCVLLGKGSQRRAARHVDIECADTGLDMCASVVSEGIARLESEGWIRTEGKRIFLIAQPKIVVLKPAIEATPDLVAAFERWLDVNEKEFAAEFKASRKDWNEKRQKYRDKFKKFVDQTADGVGPRTKSSSTKTPIIIQSLRTEELSVSECSSVSVEQSETAEIRTALTYHFGFVVSEEDAIPAELVRMAKEQNLSVEELSVWMSEKAHLKAKQRYRVTSPGAVRDWAKQDLGPWAKENAGLLAEYRKQTTAPPEQTLTLEQQIRSALEWADRTEVSQTDHAIFVSELETLEREHPAEVARERERIRAAGGKTFEAGGD